ncbi:MAG: DUF2795 domain-containing protein [Thermomicrobiales bacterium]
MFDKLKDAVGDMLQGHSETADKAVNDASQAVDNATGAAQGAVSDASQAVDNATSTAQGAVSDASQAVNDAASTAQGAVDNATAATSGGSLDNLAGELSGLVGQAGNLDGIVGQLGGLGGILEAVKGMNFPIGVDDLVPVLQKAGVPQNLIDKLQGANIGQINSPDDLVNIAKQVMSK